MSAIVDQSGNLIVTSGGGGVLTTADAPQAMWVGPVDSTMVAMIWWYPISQTGWTTGIIPSYYQVFRNGVQIAMASPPLTNPGATPDAVVYGHPLPLYFDVGLTPNTTYNYNVKAVYPNGAISGFGPTLTVTTLANGSPTPPAAATDPATWIVPYALPAGGTTWTCTNTTAASVAGTGVNNATGCSVQYALSNANINGGDVIVMTAGATYTVPLAGYVIPAFTGTNGWTYIISSEDPVYKAGGKLPAYSYNNVVQAPTVLTLSAAPAVGATNATLAANQAGLTDSSGNWLGTSGWYYVTFNTQEQRKCVFTHGSATIDWSLNNGLYAANAITGISLTTGGSGFTQGASGVPLTGGHGQNAYCVASIGGGAITGISLGPAAFPFRGAGSGYQVGDVLTVALGGGSGATATVTSVGNLGPGLLGVQPFTGATVTPNATISAMIGNWVTPWDRDTNGAMPILAWSGINVNCLSMTGGSSSVNKVRFVGIGMAQPSNTVPSTGQEFVGFVNNNPNVGQGNVVPCESIYFDRCCFGTDTEGNAWIPTVHGFSPVNCNHFLVHQCYVQGVNQGNNISGDTNAFDVSSGGPMCWQNTYMEGGSETIIVGGIYIPQFTIPHDMVMRYCFFHKPLSWAVGNNYLFFGWNSKDLLEFKVGIRAAVYGNMFLNCWQGQDPGYHAPSLLIDSREQVTTNNGIQTGCPWNQTSDIDVTNNLMYNVAGMLLECYDFSPAGKVMRIRMQNNLVYMSPPLSSQDEISGFHTEGPLPDVIVDHNTWILNSGLTIGSNTQPAFFRIDGGGTGSGTYANPSPYVPNAWHTYNDRMQITNNVTACSPTHPSNGYAFLAPAPTSFAAFTNLIITNNLTLGSSLTTYPGIATGIVYPSVAYSSIGFKVALTSDQNGPPLHPSDLNIISGTYATADQNGQPLGCTF